MAAFDAYRRVVEAATSYSIQFVMRDAAGVPQTGQVASMDVWRVKVREAPATQIMNNGVGTGTQTVVEVDAANAAGLYELELDLTDLDTPGAMTLVVKSTLAVDLYLPCDVRTRAGMTV
jgi:hypothetical protein